MTVFLRSTDWREMIDDAAYDYSIKKSKKLVNVKKFGGMFEGDIAGIDLDALDKASQYARLQMRKLTKKCRLT